MDIIGGYRLVRRLGGGPRAEVFLAHSVRVGALGKPKVVAIKRFRQSTSLESIDAEIEALARASSPHLQRLDDLAGADHGRPALILTRLGPTTLADLLLARSAIDPGEFVTMMAPLAGAVEALHLVGVAHGGVRLGSVRFDDSGAPVLCGFGSATVVGMMPHLPGTPSLTPAEMESIPAVLRDLADLVAVVRTAGAVVEPSPTRDDFLGRLDSLDVTRHPEQIAAGLIDSLFAFAEPSALDFDRAVPGAEPPTSVSVRRLGVATPTGPLDASGAGSNTVSSLWHGLALPPWLDAVVIGALGRSTEILGRARALLATVRRPVWIVAGTVAVLLIAALVLVPTDPRASADRPRSAGGEASDTSGGASRGPSETSPEESSSTAPSPAPSTSPAQSALLAADDPVPAAAILLALRRQCLLALSVNCLGQVTQPESAIEEADAWMLRQAQESPGDLSIPETLSDPVLLERLGDSALLSSTLIEPTPDQSPTPDQTSAVGASPPVTVVLMRVDGQWRLRDLIIG